MACFKPKMASDLKPLGWLLLVQSLNDSFYSLKPSGWFLLKSSTVGFYFKPCFLAMLGIGVNVVDNGCCFGSGIIPYMLDSRIMDNAPVFG